MSYIATKQANLNESNCVLQTVIYSNSVRDAICS